MSIKNKIKLKIFKNKIKLIKIKKIKIKRTEKNSK